MTVSQTQWEEQTPGTEISTEQGAMTLTAGTRGDFLRDMLEPQS